MRSIIRKIVPMSIRSFIWRAIPKLHRVNTYVLKKSSVIKKLSPIPQKYLIREVTSKDNKQLEKVELYRSTKGLERKIELRMNNPAWHGLGVFDKNNGKLAYIAWVIDRSIPYFEEFGVIMNNEQFLVKDGFCVPEYRHQGLHTRMEQERINFCINKGAKEIFIQIHNSNVGGKKSVINNGYNLHQTNLVIQWPVFNVYRSFKGFLKNPFRKVIK